MAEPETRIAKGLAEGEREAWAGVVRKVQARVNELEARCRELETEYGQGIALAFRLRDRAEQAEARANELEARVEGEGLDEVEALQCLVRRERQRKEAAQAREAQLLEALRSSEAEVDAANERTRRSRAREARLREALERIAADPIFANPYCPAEARRCAEDARAALSTSPDTETTPCGWCGGQGALPDEGGKLGRDCPRCEGRTTLPDTETRGERCPKCGSDDPAVCKRGRLNTGHEWKSGNACCSHPFHRPAPPAPPEGDEPALVVAEFLVRLELRPDATPSDREVGAMRTLVTAALNRPASAPPSSEGEARGELVREIAEWLRHTDRLDEIPGARYPGLEKNPLWDASVALEQKFGPIKGKS